MQSLSCFPTYLPTHLPTAYLPPYLPTYQQAPAEFAYPMDGNQSQINYLQAHVSACKNLDDFNPFKYQSWYIGDRSDSPPSGCKQTGPAAGDGSLALESITCEVVPLVSSWSTLAWTWREGYI